VNISFLDFTRDYVEALTPTQILVQIGSVGLYPNYVKHNIFITFVIVLSF